METGESFVYTACPGWGDHDYCAIKTIVKNGKIERTERVIYSDPEEPDGLICQKGCLACRQPYDPKRLKKPLKRKGERGGGQWEEISWDQALDEIAKKLISIKETYGSDAVSWWHLPAGVPPSQGFEMYMPIRLANLFGGTVPMSAIGLDNGPFFSEFYHTGTIFAHFIWDCRCFESTDLIWIWGCNPIENQMRVANSLVRARDKGAKIIDLGLVFDGTAGFADEFYGIKPASDLWLILAMLNYTLQNNLQDNEYLLKRTTAAYLIGADGKLKRDAEGNFYVWDCKAGAPGTVAPEAGVYPSDEIALFGEYEVEGEMCKTVLQTLKENFSEYTLTLAAEKTGVAEDVLKRLIDEWMGTKNAYIVSGLGLRYMNTNETYRAIQLFGFITGRIGKTDSGVTEGLQVQSYPIMLNNAEMQFPEGSDNVKTKGMRMADWFEAAEAPNSPYKALFVCEGNPVHQQPDRQRWLDIVNQMELVVDYDIWLTDTGEIADYVLPDCMPFEREDIIEGACYNHIVLQEPAIEPIGDVHEPVWVFTELAKRMGYGHYFDKTIPEWIDVRLNTDYPPVASIEPKVTYERLKKEKMVRANFPAEPKFNPWANMDEVFPTKTGRLELYNEELLEVGDETVRAREPYKIGKSQDYPFQLFTGRQRFFMQSSFTDDPVTVKMSGNTPSTRLNPRFAKKLGLRDGSKVEVYNDRGHVVTRLELDESVPEGTVHVWFGWRRRQFEEGTYSEITTQCANNETQGPIEKRWFMDWLATGASDNVFEYLMNAEIGGTDCYWDSYCNIRQYDGRTGGCSALAAQKVGCLDIRQYDGRKGV